MFMIFQKSGYQLEPLTHEANDPSLNLLRYQLFKMFKIMNGEEQSSSQSNLIPLNLSKKEMLNSKEKQSRLYRENSFDTNSKVEHLPICCVCNENFVKLESTGNPTLALKCGHTICQFCFQQLRTSHCPLCRVHSYEFDVLSVCNGYCAGECVTALNTIDEFYLSSCGHVYCKGCFGSCNISGLNLDVTAFNYINKKNKFLPCFTSTPNHDYECTRCSFQSKRPFAITEWKKIFFNFD